MLGIACHPPQTPPMKGGANRRTIKGGAKKKTAAKWIKFQILITIFCFHQPLFAADPSMLQTQDVTVVFEESLRSVAEEVADLYPSLKNDLEKIFQWQMDFRPTLVLAKSGQQFQKIAGTDLIVAFAVPQKKLMVIDHSKMNTSPFTPSATLKHEMCHLLLHQYIERQRLPKWLDEGICQWASDGIVEVIMGSDRSILAQAGLQGRYYPMRVLRDSFPADKASLQLAYAQSKNFVNYIIREFGKAGVLRLLNNLKYGLAFETAVEESFSISFEALETEWLDQIRKKNTWLTYLSIHIYEFIFLLGALIVVIGFVRVIIKKRAYRDVDDDLDI